MKRADIIALCAEHNIAVGKKESVRAMKDKLAEAGVEIPQAAAQPVQPPPAAPTVAAQQPAIDPALLKQVIGEVVKALGQSESRKRKAPDGNESDFSVDEDLHSSVSKTGKNISSVG